jgi:hypothetical protein
VPRCALQATLAELKQRACAAFGVSPDSVWLWDYYGGEACKELEPHLESTVQQARLVDGQPILLRDNQVGTRCWGVLQCSGWTTRQWGSAAPPSAVGAAAAQQVPAQGLCLRRELTIMGHSQPCWHICPGG